MNMKAATAGPTPPRRPFWRRWVVDPVVAMLTYGITPDRVAATLAVGTACALFPFLGFTSLLNLVVGLALRMNQPLLQGLNQLLGPVQLAMILVYVRLGERLWGATEDRFSLIEMLTTFRDVSLAEFLHRFGQAGLHALTAWLLSVPLIIAALYFSLRPAMRRLGRRLAGNA